MELRAVFVYGTLRPGEYNHWVGDAVVDIVRNVALEQPGKMTHNGAYPYLALDPTGGVITGDLLLMDGEHPDFYAMRGMELGAGYDEVEVTVRPIRLGSSVGCVAYTIPAEDHRMSLPAIPDGDWPRFRRVHLR